MDSTRAPYLLSAHPAHVEFFREWNRLNDAGEGFAIGDDCQTVVDVNALDVGELVHRSNCHAPVAVYRDGDSVTIVGDVGGPWAVAVKECE